MMSNTLHIIGVPHTIANSDYSVCAFTSKVYLFPDVIIPFGWYVMEYSNEGSQSSAHEHIVILDKQRFQELSRRQSREDGLHLDLDNEQLNKEFKEKTIRELQARVKPGDIVCHVWGPDVEIYDAVRNCHHLELSVGYGATPGLPFRIFESSAWMHYHYGRTGEDDDGSNYKWVIPSAFDDEKWVPGNVTSDYVLFHGRVTARKGINIIVEIAKRMPELDFRICGPGDVTPWLENKPANLYFDGQLFGDARVQKVQGALCVLTPTQYVEPFGFSGIEAQLCGVPQIGSCFGAFLETIIEDVTGYRCHTLADWIAAIRKCGSLDRFQIAKLARERYAKSAVGRQYNWALRQLSDLSGDGWYGTHSRKYEPISDSNASNISKIWLYIPYFGDLPNYFDLFLRSLAKNEPLLNIVMLTDIDLTQYDLPPNFFPVPMTLPNLRLKILKFLQSEFGVLLNERDIIKNAYKLVDFRPIYLDLFASVGEWLDIDDNDYVGWGDIDMILGQFSRFMNLEQDCEIIGGFHGHFTAFRNSGYARTVYKTIPDLIKLMISDDNELVDEMALRQPILQALERHGGKMFYINRYFCDVVPEMFVSRFRPEGQNNGNFFFEAYHPELDIKFIDYKSDGKLQIYYSDGSVRETVYCHLQKRRMKRDVQRPEAGFTIWHDSFTDREIAV